MHHVRAGQHEVHRSPPAPSPSSASVATRGCSSRCWCRFTPPRNLTSMPSIDGRRKQRQKALPGLRLSPSARPATAAVKSLRITVHQSRDRRQCPRYHRPLSVITAMYNCPGTRLAMIGQAELSLDRVSGPPGPSLPDAGHPGKGVVSSASAGIRWVHQEARDAVIDRIRHAADPAANDRTPTAMVFQHGDPVGSTHVAAHTDRT